MASVEADWVDLGQDEHVEFTANLEQTQDHVFLFAKDAPKEENVSTSQNDEYLLTLTADIENDKLPWLQDVKNEQVEFLVILDKSGSMQGRPWQQVQSAATRMVELVGKNSDKVRMRIVTYNQSAEFLDAKPSKMSEQLKSTRAGGSTNFVATFHKIQEYMQELAPGNFGVQTNSTVAGWFKKQPPLPESTKPKKLFVFFMTDGCDTCNNDTKLLEAREHLQAGMEKYGAEVVVHVLGFSANHDETFLQSLSLMGTSDGSYSFIAPEDGDEALEQRLVNLLEATTLLIGKSVFVDLTLAEGGQFLGNFFGKSEDHVVLQTFIHAGDKVSKLETSKFIKLPNQVAKEDPSLKLTVTLLQDLRDGSPKIPAQVAKVNLLQHQSGSKQSAAITLRKLRTCLNMVTAKMFDSETVSWEDMQKVHEELRPWHGAILRGHEAIKVAAKKHEDEDPEVAKLCDAVRNGLAICSGVFEDKSQDLSHRSKKMRSAQTSYYVKSEQMHNIVQSSESGEKVERKRNMLQQKQRIRD